MAAHSLNKVAMVAWLTVVLCSVLFLFIAICAPETTLVRDTRERDDSIRSIESSSDLRQLQRTATGLLQAGYATSATAMVFCHVTLATHLLIGVGAVITLMQVRRMRRQAQDTNAA
jgi:energy-converting hydrogenase Eha subunit C